MSSPALFSARLQLFLPLFLLFFVPSVVAQNSLSELTEERGGCASYYQNRQVFFGDLHVHTSYSIDAALQDTRNTPQDAYRFARGEKLGVHPYDDEGRALRSLKLRRPLDFAAVTDHAEMLGEVAICSTPGMRGYYSLPCLAYRWFPKLAFFWMNERSVNPDKPRFGFCGKNGERCLNAAGQRWQSLQDAAEEAYDRRPSCAFTSFVAYEWTANAEVNLHRNVIFRNRQVPEQPTSAYEAATAEKLWDHLRTDCTQNCDVITIPHNSNLSDGQMFPSPTDLPMDGLTAQQRLAIEPLLEIFQHKGDSECWFGAGAEDELCAFEKLPYATFRGKFMDSAARVPTVDSGFARGVLADGMRYAQTSGVNPYQLGFIGSTDTHLGTPGQVSESGHIAGHGGAGKGSDGRIPEGFPDSEEFNPGGLAAVWAEQNTRDALFLAMRRRETYSTSGPRIQLRFFGGWDLLSSICAVRRNFARKGYRSGVPMGGVLPAMTERKIPRFAINATRDPGTRGAPGNPLQTIQVVKVWVDEAGDSRERVYDIGGQIVENDIRMNPSQCDDQPSGSYNLCSIWLDPDFDSSEQASYYARAVEVPSCRWSQRVCNVRGVDCERPETIGDGLEYCCSAEHRPIIQERAVSSPIWYTPEN